MTTARHEVEVRHAGGDEYEVTVRSDTGERHHLVRVSARSREQYGGGAEPDRLVAESFRWVLEREPDAKLLARFDLPVIADSHPEYAREIWHRLQ